MSLRERSEPPAWMVRTIAEAIRAAVGSPDYVARIAAEDIVQDRRYTAELEAVKNERDLAVLTLAAFTPADKPNQGARG